RRVHPERPGRLGGVRQEDRADRPPGAAAASGAGGFPLHPGVGPGAGRRGGQADRAAHPGSRRRELRVVRPGRAVPHRSAGGGRMSAGTTRTVGATDAAAEAGRGPVVPVAGEADLVPPPRRSWRGVWVRALSLCALVAAWWVASLFFSPTVLPGPPQVVAAMIDNLGDPETYYHLWTTVYRVVAGMLIAVGAGLVIGLLMGLSRFGEEFLDSWVLVAFTVPSVVYGILAILWFGLNDVAAIVAIGVTAVPAVAIN